MEPEEKPKKELWLWCDLETTGLNPEKGEILEVAFALYDPITGKEYFRFSEIVKESHHSHKAIDDEALRLHIESGLLAELLDAKINASHAEDSRVVMFIKDLFDVNGGELRVEDGYVIKLAGSSIGQFDLTWLRRHFPKLSGLLHYRVVDVSSLMALIHSLGLDKDDFKAKPSTAHRAEGDMAASIQTFYNIQEYFKRLNDIEKEMK